MAFKQVCTSLLVVVACCSVLSTAQQLSYLRDNDQNGFPCQNHGSFTYLRDNGANQGPAVYPIQSGPVNYINNIGNPQIQTIASYPSAFNSVGFVGNNGFGSNIVNNVNSLSAIEYPVVAQSVPVYNQVVSYPSVQPVAQYAVQQPAFVGGSVAYPNNNNQVTNTQVSPVEINFGNQQPNVPCFHNYPRSY